MTTTQLVFYSPTGTTRKNLEAMVEGFGGENLDAINLTKKEVRDSFNGNVDADVIFIGVPIYGGTIPPIVRDSIRKIKGEGKWVVLVGTYGNVKTGLCLNHLSGILTPNGFKVLGTATCLGEHSFAFDDLPLGTGRPDESDLAKAREFGQSLRKKFDSNPVHVEMESVELPPPKPRTTSFLLPEVILENCTKCMSCVQACPANAISKDDLSINPDLCTMCCACVKACNFGAREIVSNMPEEKFEKFHTNCDRRLEPEFIL